MKLGEFFHPGLLLFLSACQSPAFISVRMILDNNDKPNFFSQNLYADRDLDTMHV